MNGVWERQTGKYASGEDYRIGKVVVGSAGFSGTVSKGDPLRYVASVALPGISMKTGTNHFASIEEAKARTEAAVATWFKWLAADAAKEK